MDAFAALTGLDEENILLSLYAKRTSRAKVVTKINRINFSGVLSDIKLDTISYPRLVTADMIIKYARSMNESLNSNVENLYKLEDGHAEALEFYIKEDSAVTNIPLNRLHIRKKYPGLFHRPRRTGYYSQWSGRASCRRLCGRSTDTCTAE